MTKSSLKSITPDSITGMIFALEGMKNTIVLLNGPMGCRFFHSTTSQFMTIRPVLYLPGRENGERVPVDYNYLNDFFFRQDRVPCTYLDGYDYVYGTKEKVRRALEFIKTNIQYDIIAIINSPGAALIGDNLLELARETLGESRVVMLESSGYSSSFAEGYSEAALALLQQVGEPLWEEKPPRREGAVKKVNLLGMSIWQLYQWGDVRELRRLLSLFGIEVNAVLCAQCGIDELAALPAADLNVVLYPEMGMTAAEYLRERHNMPCYICDTLPVGFSATEKLLADLCGILGASDEAVRAECEQARALAWYKINSVYMSSGKPKGVKFYVDGGASLDKAFTAFLTEYLGMEPTGAEDAELVFSNANVISELMLKNKTFCGILVSWPEMGYVDVLPKTYFGIQGALFLIEQVLNGLMSKL